MLKGACGTWDPEMFKMDNGSQYAPTLFADFATEWQFQYVTSSPHNPQANGCAKCMLCTIKHTL